MNTIVNFIKKYTFISIFIIFMLSNAFTELRLQDYLSMYMPFQIAYLSSIFIKQMGCFAILLYLAYKLKLTDDFNLTLKKPLKSLTLIIPLIVLCLMNVTGIEFDKLPKSILVLVLYCLAFLSTGFFEEILFRGIIFNLINNKYGTSKKMFYVSVIVSSVIFGSSHLTTYFNGTKTVLNVSNQIFYAAVIGVLFTAIYLRCNSLLVPIIIHGLIDITGDQKFLAITSKELEIKALIEQPMSMDSIIANLILFIPLLIWALFILRKVKITEKICDSKVLE